MIKKITVENFQSHRKTVLELHPGINIITGDTDSGKSGFFRSIFWNYKNRPIGMMFVSDWNKKGKDKEKFIGETSVELEFDDGSVKRYRNPEANGYSLNGEKKEAIGKEEVPAAIRDFWNMNEANFSGQHDLPFLLAIGGGQVAEYLNRIVHLDIVDVVLAKAESQRRDLGKEIKRNDEDLKAVRDRIKRLEWVEKALEVFDHWSDKRIACRALQDKAELITERMDQIVSVHKDILVKEAALTNGARVLDLMKLHDKWVLADKRDTRMVEFLEGIETIQKLIAGNTGILKKVPDMIELLNLYDVHSNTKGRITRLDKALDEIDQLGGDLDKNEKFLKLAKDVQIIVEKINARREGEKSNMKLDALLLSIDELGSDIEVDEKKIITLQDELNKDADGLCPICGSEHLEGPHV